MEIIMRHQLLGLNSASFWNTSDRSIQTIPDFNMRYVQCFTLKTILVMLLRVSFACIPVLGFAQLPTINLIESIDASEAGPQPGSFVVTRSVSTAAALQIKLDVQGTAGIQNDYSTNPILVWQGGTTYYVDIPPNQLSVTVVVTPVQDGANEGDETAIFTLVGEGETYAAGPNTQAEVVIADDVPVVNLTLPEPASEIGPTPGGFTVTRSDNGIISQALRILLDVQGTAAIQNDYSTSPILVWQGGTSYYVDIPPNQLSVAVVVTPKQDGVVEGDETAVFTLLTDDTRYTVGEPVTAIVPIADFVENIFKDSFEDL
jgi:hypothetical protein